MFRTTCEPRRPLAARRSHRAAGRAAPWAGGALLLLSGLAQAALGPANRHQLEKLEIYRVNGKDTVVLAVAADGGKGAEVEALTRTLGGRVDYVHRDTDYLAVVLPMAQAERFLEQAPLAAFAVENTWPELIDRMSLWSPSPWDPDEVPKQEQAASPVRNARADWPPRPGMGPVEHPHDILEDMDGVAFRKRDPGNDGRGVVIAHLESFPDLLAPELQTALDAEGNEIPKFHDVINVPGVNPSLDPDAPRVGSHWSHRLGAPLEARQGVVVSEGRRHRVPAPGSYRLALFDLRRNDGAIRRVWPTLRSAFHGRRWPQEMKPDDPDVVLRTRVLWSDARRMLWVDTDQDGDFDDETGVPEYAHVPRFGVFGRDKPDTVLRESVGFTVQKDGDYVSLNLAMGAHDTFVAAAAAARKGRYGRIDGVAPGAQLLPVWSHNSDQVSAFVRSMIVAYEHPAVDVVLIEGHARITTDYEIALDGRSLVGVVLDRLQKRHDKPTLFTANNTPGMSTIFDATVPAGVIAVGAYQSAEAVYAQTGLHVRHADDFHWAGSEGPAGNGLFKPDLLAPANPTSVFPGHSDRPDTTRREGVWDMPSRYTVCGGTSCATPVAAGAAALLVGAARREGLPVTGTAIHRALRDGARRIGRIGVYQQGRGLLQIDAAWRRLQQLARETPETIQVSAPVRSVASAWLEQPHQGQGLFEREGWHAGMQARRTLTLTRTDGPAEPVRYRLEWIGDREAFRSAAEVVLPLNRPVALEVDIATPRPRVYSAWLELRREGLAGPAAVVPATVVVPHRFEASKAHTVELEFELDRPGRSNLFFDVPPDAGLLNVQVTGPRGAIRAGLHAPDNWPYVAFAPLDEMPEIGGLTLDRPMAGTWQLILHDADDLSRHDWSIPPGQVLPGTRLKVRAALVLVDAAIEGDRIAIRNQGAAFDGGLRTHALAAMREERIALGRTQALEREIDVAPGTELLLLELEREQEGTGMPIIELYRCSKPGDCRRHRFTDWNGGQKRIAVERPEAGAWTVRIANLDHAPAVVRYRQVQAHARYGVLVSADARQARASGAQWQVPFQLWRREAPGAGDRPAAILRVDMAGTRLAGAGGPARERIAPALLRVVPLPEPSGGHGAR